MDELIRALTDFQRSLDDFDESENKDATWGARNESEIYLNIALKAAIDQRIKDFIVIPVDKPKDEVHG